ncbi:MAG: Histone deacetylase hda1, partial [Lichina confinis]
MDAEMVDAVEGSNMDAPEPNPNSQATIDPSVLVKQQPMDLALRDAVSSTAVNGTISRAENGRRSAPAVADATTRQHQASSKDSAVRPQALSTALLPSGVCYDARMRFHSTLVDDDDHPEDPRRISVIYKTLVKAGLIDETLSFGRDSRDFLRRVEAREATADEICLVHNPGHYRLIRQTRNETVENLRVLSDSGDSVYYNNSTYMCARLAVGGAIECCKAVVAGTVKNAIAVIRPPGHHAVPTEAQGFCIFNNVSVAARVCQAAFRDKCRKILIFDWDVHHGNGTQDAFYEDPNVLYISIHVHQGGRFYPGGESGNHKHCGAGYGVGKNVNVPWTDQGMGDADYMYAFRNVVLPIAAEFDPDLVLGLFFQIVPPVEPATERNAVSAGFDAAEGDEIGACFVTPACYAHMTHALMALAGGKVVVCLEGGYNLQSISNCALAVTKTLMGEAPERLKLTAPSKLAIEDVHQVMRRQSPYWFCLSAYGPTRDFSSVGGKRMHDIIRVYQTRVLRDELGMITLAVLRNSLTTSFADQVIATPDLIGVPQPETLKLEAHQTWLTDPIKDYIHWADKEGFGVVDVNVPKLLSDADTIASVIEDGEPAAVNAMKELAVYLWDNYLQLADATKIFFLGAGNAHQGIVHLLNLRNCSPRLYGIVNVLSDIPLRSVRRDADPDFATWYFKNSLVYVNGEHDTWAPDRKGPKRRFGRVIKSDENGLHRMLFYHKQEITSWISRRSQHQRA